MRAFLADLSAALTGLPSAVRSLRPGVQPDDSPARHMRRNFVYHLHPLKVALRTLRPTTTFGLGIITLGLFFILIVTGLALMLYYVPTPEHAYASMLDIESAVTFGELARRMHRYAAHAMVVTVALHLVRVWAVAGYRRRELNWLIGLGLFMLVLGLAFTGYLLPWDQTSYWAVRVVANMADYVPAVGAALKRLTLGGLEIGPATLVRFYALHVAVLPVPMLLLAALHLWRIRRDGGLARPADEEASTVSAWPHLVLREGMVLLALVAAITLWALLVDCPLDPPANTLRPSNPEKAPWYFVGFQEMVSYSAVVGGFVFPGAIAVLLLAMPFLDRRDEEVGRYLGSDRREVAGMALAGIVVVVTAMATLWHAGVAAEIARLAAFAQDAVNPAGVMVVYAFVAFWVVGWRRGSVRAAMRVSLVILLVSVILFTVIGMLRGPNWVFYWPWEEWPGGV